MTPRTWAAKLVERTPVTNGESDAQFMERLVLNQHARSVRIVKAEIAKQIRVTKYSSCDAEIAEAQVKIHGLNIVLAALQRGRTGRGK